MSRYIDAESFEDDLIGAYCFPLLMLPKGKFTLFDVIDMIRKRPIEDVAPVKHGHWIDMGDFEQCSACKGTHLKEFNSFYGNVTWIETAYCPHCGALMDEKVTE